jgi:tetratricopeptide (TPR) repeat protein
MWPVGLSVFYETPYIVQPGFSNFVLPLLAVAIAGAGFWLVARSSRAGRLAAVWLVLPILPLLNVSVFRWADIVHDRYMYLPSVGFVLIIALAVRRLRFGTSLLFGLPAVQVVVALVLPCLLGIALVSQHIHWANNLLLFHNSLVVAPNSRDAKTKLGGAFIDRGMFKEGLQLLGEVYDNDPDSWDSNQEVGGALYRAGRYQDAEKYLTRAIEIRPSRGESHYFLGIALLDMNRLADAERPLREAVRIDPRSVFYHYALGAWFDLRGDPRSALEEFRLELANNPNYSPARDKILEMEARLSGSAGRPDADSDARHDQVDK